MSIWNFLITKLLRESYGSLKKNTLNDLALVNNNFNLYKIQISIKMYVRPRIFWLTSEILFFLLSLIYLFFRENTLHRTVQMIHVKPNGVSWCFAISSQVFCALSTTRRPVSKFLQFRLIWIHVCLRNLHKMESKCFWSHIFY